METQNKPNYKKIIVQAKVIATFDPLKFLLLIPNKMS